jgi:RND family efflux transporter MFP subunit
MNFPVTFFRRHKKLAIWPPLLLGVGIFAFVMASQSGPKLADLAEKATSVRVLKAPEVAVIPRAIGYGYVQPGQIWEAMAEVGGKIVELNPELKKGNILAKDTVLLRIDPAEPGFIRGQSEADVDSVLAQIRELDQKEKDTRRQLGIEKKKMELTAKDLERQRKLAEQAVISTSELDRQEQNYLTQQNVVQNYQSTLNSIPSERQSLLAKLAAARHRLSDARLDEERTILRAPFDCRVAEVNVERDEAVKIGDILARLDSIGVSEAFVQVPLDAFRKIVPQDFAPPLAAGEFSREKIVSFLGVEAIVRVKLADVVAEWEGRLSRLADAVDAQTRTLGVYVAVDNSYLKARSGLRPPLIKNMYAEVELRGRPRTPGVVVPRSAVHRTEDHGDVVYVMDADNRLRRRPVKIRLEQANFASIGKGVRAGENIVVSDIVPAIDGMLLAPVPDNALLRELTAEAGGEREAK